MAADPRSCPICERPAADGVRMDNSGQFDGIRVECPQCGQFELVGAPAFAASFHWDADLRCGLSCAARQAHEAGDRVRITGHNAEEIAAPHMSTRVADNQERLLHVVARRATRPHVGVEFSAETDFTLIDCFSPQEFRWHLEWLQLQKLVSPSGALTMEGWNRAQPFPRQGGTPGNCFVAMWFSDDLRASYEAGIEPAVEEAGFKPIRIDRKEHNNEITDEIIAEIRNCQFMVADFTGQRSGVYYEAGFAMGLGRPVIWCCHKDEIGKLHFDTNHKNHIDWQTPEELRERLYKRIRATILEQG